MQLQYNCSQYIIPWVITAMRMSYKIQTNIPMALSGGAGVEELVGGAPNFSSLSVMVDVEPDLEKMEGGPKWVSFNSVVEVLVAVFL